MKLLLRVGLLLCTTLCIANAAFCQIEQGSTQSEALDSTAISTLKYDDDGSNGIFGRRVTYRNVAPILKNANGISGKIGFKVCINPEGEVVAIELIENETTIEKKEALEQATKAIYGYKFEANPDAIEHECGKIILNIEAFGERRGF